MQQVLSFSVVIPVFNGEAHIATAIHSVLNQEYPTDNVEIIVVDDGSTDGTRNEVLQIADRRIRLISKANGRVASARNVGINASSHEWIAFLDSDDFWLPGFLAEINAAISEHPNVVAAFSNVFYESLNDKALNVDGIEQPLRVSNYLAFVMRYGDGEGATASSIAIRKSSLEQVGLFRLDALYGEDTDTWMRLAWIGEFAFVPKVLAVYTSAFGESMTNTRDWAEAVVPIHFTRFITARARGEIPEHLLQDTRRYVFGKVDYYAKRFIVHGNKQELKKMLIPPAKELIPLQSWLMYQACLAAPTWLVNTLVRMRNATIQGWTR